MTDNKNTRNESVEDEEKVSVPFDEDNTGDQAVLLMAAVEEAGLDPSVVETRTAPPSFLVPKSIADKVGKSSEKSAEKKAEGAEKRATKVHSTNKTTPAADIPKTDQE